MKQAPDRTPDYSADVAEFGVLRQRSESDPWRMAELTGQQVEEGTSRRHWGKDNKVSHTYINRLYQVWVAWGWQGGNPVSARPSFSDAYAATKATPISGDASYQKFVVEARMRIARIQVSREEAKSWLADGEFDHPEDKDPNHDWPAMKQHVRDFLESTKDFEPGYQEEDDGELRASEIEMEARLKVRATTP